MLNELLISACVVACAYLYWHSRKQREIICKQAELLTAIADRYGKDIDDLSSTASNHTVLIKQIVKLHVDELEQEVKADGRY